MGEQPLTMTQCQFFHCCVYNRMPSRYAFVTLLYGNKPYFVETLALAKSLQRLRTSVDVVLMLGAGTSEEVQEVIRSSNLFTHIIKIPSMEVHPSHIGTTNRWSHLIFGKCYIWSFVQYRKVMFIDADIIVRKRKAFKQLFEDFSDTDIPAAPLTGDDLFTHKKRVNIHLDDPKHSKVSASLLIISPSMDVFVSIKEALKKPSTHANKFFTNHEEVFLATFFPRWLSIHINYQFPPLLLLTYNGTNKPLNRICFKDIIAVHFTGYKPHIYLAHPEYLDHDKKTYRQLSSKDSSVIFDRSIRYWLKAVNKVDGQVYEKTNKTFLEIGDWETPISYKG